MVRPDGGRFPWLHLQTSAAKVVEVGERRVRLRDGSDNLRRPPAHAGHALLALEAERLVQPEGVIADVCDDHKTFRLMVRG